MVILQAATEVGGNKSLDSTQASRKLIALTAIGMMMAFTILLDILLIIALNQAIQFQNEQNPDSPFRKRNLKRCSIILISFDIATHDKTSYESQLEKSLTINAEYD